jgi:hypothetical protein
MGSEAVGRTVYGRSRRARRGSRRSSEAARRRRVGVALAVVALAVAVAATAGGRGHRVVTYDRARAAAYADRWAMSFNPSVWHSATDDCADFVSQCVQAGGMPAMSDPGGQWQGGGSSQPPVAWINCGAQLDTWTSSSAGHSAFIVKQSARLPKTWAVGDVVYLGNLVQGLPDWEHVVICVGKRNGHWLYDSHTKAHLRRPMSTWFPGHGFTLVRYCHLAGTVEVT